MLHLFFGQRSQYGQQHLYRLGGWSFSVRLGTLSLQSSSDRLHHWCLVDEARGAGDFGVLYAFLANCLDR